MSYNILKNTKPLSQTITLLFIWLLMGIISSVLVALLTIAGVDVLSTDNLLWIQPLSQILSFIIPVAIYIVAFHADEKDHLHFATPLNPWQALSAIAIMLLLIPAVDWITLWNDNWHLPQSMHDLETTIRDLSKTNEQMLSTMLLTDDTWHLILNILVIALCPAICEELFFRGALQQSLQRCIHSPHWTIIITAAIFSIAHLEPFAFMPRLLLGIILGYLYHLSGNIIVNMCAHFINNALIVVLYYLHARGTITLTPDQPLQIDPALTIATTVAAAALFYLYFVNKQKQSSETIAK